MTELTSLRDSTRQLLLDRPASLSTATIAKEIKVSTAWITAFARGAIDNPGVNTIETLNAYLKNNAKKAR
jgi:hypothetical protein